MIGWLSSFLMNPTMAAGAGAVAGPILIHILAKRRFRRIRWAAMDFLLDAERQNRRRVRLEQWLLLALRCLAVFLIAFMMMRPFVRPGFVAGMIGASGRTERIIVVDDSFSMGYQSRGSSTGDSRAVFDQACDAALQLARWFASESPRDPLTLYLTSAPREPLVALASLSDDSLDQLRNRLNGARPSARRSQMDVALAAVADVIARTPTEANHAIYVISDFQRVDWILPPAPDDAQDKPVNITAPLTALSRGGVPINLVLVNVGDASAENAALLDLRPLRPQTVAGVPTRFEAAVANYSSDAIEQVELNISIADSRLPPVIVGRVPAGQVVREPFEVTFPNDGANYVQVELAGAERFGNGVRIDDRRAVALEVLPAIQILIVNGEPSSDSFRDEVYLLRTALRPAGRAASGNDLTIIEEPELDSADLSRYHVVVLANVARMTPSAARMLEEYVRGGGGLAIFGGAQIDIDYYNDALYRSGDGLMPVRLLDTTQAPAGVEPVTFGRWNVNNPMLRAFDGPLASLLRQVKVRAFLSSAANDESDTSPSSQPVHGTATATEESANDGTLDRAGAASPVRVLARFSDPDESPAIVQRRLGRGITVFIATTVDQDWNDWASNFSYLPMMLELVQYCAKTATAAGQVTVGQPVTFELDAGRFEDRSILEPPSYPMRPAVTLTATSAGSGRNFEFRETDEPGLCRILLTPSGSGPASIHYAAVNPDPAESNLGMASRSELQSALVEELPFEYVGDLSALESQSATSRIEYWWPLLLAAGIVLMFEQGLAWWFGTRG
ncbi:MAG: BatA domain-containing protein [Phycisphaerae bacterium]|nr:BatA domain-containing protein [Phycisphaerae bacterium]